MKYRTFGSQNESLSTLALGLNHLTDCPDSRTLIRTAIEAGITYIDLGPGLDQGHQARINRLTGEALVDGFRGEVRLALHLPVFAIRKRLDLETFLIQHTTALKTGWIDYFILDGINRDTWPAVWQSGVLAKLSAARKSGLVRQCGFSFRDQTRVLREILEHGDDWALCQFDFSYMDADHYPGISGLRLAMEHGLAVVAAEPLKGGRLTRIPPAAVAGAWNRTMDRHGLMEWGLRWVWNHPEVTTVIGRPGSLEQLRELVNLADTSEAGAMGVQEQLLINQVRDAYRKLKPIPCNTCRACMPCPEDIDVPRILELYNDAQVYEDLDTAREIFQRELHQLEDCNECGVCVKRCGRMIAILDWLDAARDLFGP